MALLGPRVMPLMLASSPVQDQTGIRSQAGFDLGMPEHLIGWIPWCPTRIHVGISSQRMFTFGESACAFQSRRTCHRCTAVLLPCNLLCCRSRSCPPDNGSQSKPRKGLELSRPHLQKQRCPYTRDLRELEGVASGHHYIVIR